MSHELDFTTGRAAIAYRGGVPWHQHGDPILDGDDLATIRRKAGCAWEVNVQPIFFRKPEAPRSTYDYVKSPAYEQVPGRKLLTRSDTDGVLSIVSDSYKVFQPSAVFRFFQELVNLQGLSIEVAGALDGGRKIWALARIDDSFTIYGRDEIKPYVLLATSFDGTLATTAMLTTVRVVCNNTLRFSGAFTADEKSADVYKVRHDVEFNITEAHGKLGLNESAWLDYKSNMERLARFQVSPEEVLEFFFEAAGHGDKIVRNEDNNNIISFPEPGRVVKQFVQAYKHGPGAALPSADGTLFGALNAVTFYQDHLAPAGDRAKRFNSATFGGGNVRKQHALELCLDKLEVA